MLKKLKTKKSFQQIRSALLRIVGGNAEIEYLVIGFFYFLFKTFNKLFPIGLRSLLVVNQ